MSRLCLTLAAGLVFFGGLPTAHAQNWPGAETGSVAQNAARRLANYGMASGRFEVVAQLGPEGAQLGELAEQAWAVWRGPMGLPERWPSGITVRLSPADAGPAVLPGWRVTAEPGGVVGVWIQARRAGDLDDLAEQRRLLAALAAGALRRQAIFAGVALDRITVPAWLCAGAAEAVVMRRQPAMNDAWQREVATWARLPGLQAVLDWSEGALPPGGDSGASAYTAWAWLQLESGRSGAWHRYLAEILGGAEAMAALSRNYAAGFAKGGPQELELAWQTGAANLVAVKNVPVMEASETRRWLEQMDRLVLLNRESGQDEILSLAEGWPERKSKVITAQREERAALLAANFRRMHPFYRNAAGSLGRAWLALGQEKNREWRRAFDELRQDMASGRELEAASARILGGGE